MDDFLLKTFLLFFTTISPLHVAGPFAALTSSLPGRERLRVALWSNVAAALILIVFALVGDDVLSVFGIDLPALEIAGGVLLLVLSLRMVLEPASLEEAGRGGGASIIVFPMAMPIIAGPAALTAAILGASHAGDDPWRLALVAAMIVVNIFLSWLVMLGAAGILRVLGRTGVAVITQIMGLILASVAVNNILTGIKSSGLLSD